MANLESIEQFDGMAGLRNGLRKIAAERGDWSGIPMPISGERLVVEPNYPYAEIANIGKDPDEDETESLDFKVRNVFWSKTKRNDVVICEENGKIVAGLMPGNRSLNHALSTLKCSEAWGIEQEANAVQLLAGLVRHRAFKQYMLTGMFIETSKRSRVTYIFRRLRPTIALRPTKDGQDMRILCTLCMHPIAYYQDSWAGAMCPTDDVISHLMLMRADEKMFWRRSNQHAAHRPESGL